MNILAQILGAGAMVSLFLIYQQKERKKMIAAKLSADIFWVAHYWLLKAPGGMIPNFVGIFRELVFINRKSKKWASLIIWPIIFILINWGLGIKTFTAWYNLLPLTASTFVTISLWLDNPRLTKLMTIPISLAFLIYDIFVSSYIGIINESVSIGSIIIYFIRERALKHKEMPQ